MHYLRRLNVLVLTTISSLLASVSSADEDCAFSQSGMLQEVQRVASAYPGATVDKDLLVASWKTDGVVVETFSASGCHDYSKQARRITREIARRNVEDVKLVAIELGKKFMEADDFAVLHEGLSGGLEFTRDSDKLEFAVINYRFGEILITHSFAEGVDSVGIAWPVL